MTDQEHNYKLLELIIPGCEALYQLNLGGSYEGYRKNLEKAKKLFKSKYPDSSDDDFNNFIDSCNHYYKIITGCDYFSGKTKFWKDTIGEAWK